MSETLAAMEFDATVVTPARGPGALVVLPDDATSIFGSRARMAVRASFNRVAYRGSAVPMGDGRFALGLTKAVRHGARIEVGIAALAYSHRREYVAWVTGAKRAETRERRVAKAIVMVGDGETLS